MPPDVGVQLLRVRPRRRQGPPQPTHASEARRVWGSRPQRLAQGRRHRRSSLGRPRLQRELPAHVDWRESQAAEQRRVRAEREHSMSRIGAEQEGQSRAGAQEEQSRSKAGSGAVSKADVSQQSGLPLARAQAGQGNPSQVDQTYGRERDAHPSTSTLALVPWHQYPSTSTLALVP